MPQGSGFGPVLFLLDVTIPSGTKLLADDLKIYRPLHYPVYDLQTLQSDLYAFADRSKLWHLNVSPEKRHVLHINFQHERFVWLRGEVLPNKDDVHDLGVLISCKFN